MEVCLVMRFLGLVNLKESPKILSSSPSGFVEFCWQILTNEGDLGSCRLEVFKGTTLVAVGLLINKRNFVFEVPNDTLESLPKTVL